MGGPSDIRPIRVMESRAHVIQHFHRLRVEELEHVLEHLPIAAVAERLIQIEHMEWGWSD